MPRGPLNSVLTTVATLAALAAAACATHRADTAGFGEPPQRLWSPPLVYPESLMLAQVEGSVLLQARVDTSGRIDHASIRVLKSTNAAFEAPAIAMLQGTRFRPAYSPEGAPAVALIEMPVRFELGYTVRDSVSAARAVADGERLATTGAIGPAMAAFTEAQRLDSRLVSSPTIQWALCWYGSLWGYAEDVIGTCDRLVARVPDAVRARDARGVARALTGNLAGAVADFEMVVAASTNERQRAERAEWIRVLRAGRNPVTPEVLERLRSGEP